MEAIDFERAYEVASEGKITYKAIAEALNCSQRRLRVLRQQHPDFDRTLLQAREDGFFALADSVLTIFEDNPGKSEHEIKIRSENIKWYLGKLFARVFGDKIDINVTERIDIKVAIAESRGRLRIVNPQLLDSNPFSE